MDNVVFVILGAALIAGGTVAHRESAWVYPRALSAATITAGAIMLLIGLVNVLSGTSG